jgi:hypothetical protein
MSKVEKVNPQTEGNPAGQKKRPSKSTIPNTKIEENPQEWQ